MKTIKYKSLDEAMKNLEAKNRGSYYTCRCPHCGQLEGFFYLGKTDSFIIKCNRLSHCGKTTRIILDSKVSKSQLQKFALPTSSSTIDIKPQGINILLNFLNRSHEKTLPSEFRGISKETLNNFIIFYPKGVKSLFGKPEDNLFGKKYFKNHFNSRDIIIPIRNKDGIPERCLLRSTKPVKGLKEFQMRLIDNGNEIWNVSDIYDKSKEYIFVCEGVFDALSIKDVLGGTLNKDKFGYIALAGVGKHSQILRLLKNNPDLWMQPLAKRKTLIICFDVDKAGITEAHKFWYNLKKLDIPVLKFNPLAYNAPLNKLSENVDGYLLDGTIDMNDWYQKDPDGFSKAFRDFTYYM